MDVRQKLVLHTVALLFALRKKCKKRKKKLDLPGDHGNKYRLHTTYYNYLCLGVNFSLMRYSQMVQHLLILRRT